MKGESCQCWKVRVWLLVILWVLVINANFQNKCPLWSLCNSSQEKHNNSSNFCRARDRDIFASNTYQLYQSWFLSPLSVSLQMTMHCVKLPQSKNRGAPNKKLTYFWCYLKWCLIQVSIAHRKPVGLISFLCNQTSKSIENYKCCFAYVCHNFIKLIDQSDFLLVAIWQLFR